MIESPIKTKSVDFALRIIKLYKFLTNEKKEFVISKQILRSGTSIGANVAEADCAQTKPDFLTKMSIALKEASETLYWLELLHKAEYLDDKQYESVNNDSEELFKLLTSIVKKTRENLEKEKEKR